MKIHLKKVLVSLLVIAGFFFYAIYQRYFIAQQAIETNAPPDTVADLNTSETVSTTTVSQTEKQSVNQAETVSPTNPPETFAGNVIGDDNEYGDDGEYGDDDEEDEGFVLQQITQPSASQTTSGASSSTTAATAGNTTSTTATSAGTTSVSTSATTATAATALYKDGQYDGNAADAYYGLVQVRAIVEGGNLTEVQFLSYPNDRNKSIQINTYAMPKLNAEAVKAQSAKVNIVSGATNTSLAFMNSLSSALNQALV